MEAYRLGETLLRSSQSLILPFFAPSAYRAPHATRAAAPTARHCRTARNQCQTSRSFATSQCHRQQGAAAAPAPTFDEDPSPPQDFPSTSPRASRPFNDKLSNLLDRSLDLTKDSSRTSHFSSRGAQANEPPSPNDAKRSSVDELLDSIGVSKNPPPRRPRTVNSIFNAINGLGDDLNGVSPAPEPEEVPMKLGSTIGRTIKVDNNKFVDVGRAFRMLEMECARNSVKRDFMRQRFHERPGLKRKRLKSERWRKNFRKNFTGIVAMVQKMRKQGW